MFCDRRFAFCAMLVAACQTPNILPPNGSSAQEDVDNTMGATGTTDNAPPQLVSLTPADSATLVSVRTPVTATFDEAIDALQATFTLTSAGGNVTGSLATNGSTITFTPAAPLAYGTTYTATLAGVRDLSGNAIPAPLTASFTTLNGTPALALVSHASGQDIIGARAITITGTIADLVPITGATALQNGQSTPVTFDQGSFTLQVTLADNTNGFSVTVTNAAQNSDTLSFTLVYPVIRLFDFQRADVIIGQPDFVTATLGSTDLSSYTSSWGHPVLADGVLYVPDSDHNRVLAYQGVPTTNGTPAAFVLGQSSPTGTVSDTSAAHFNEVQTLVTDGTRLFVSDYGNARVMIWNSLPKGNVAADVVVGQPSFGVSAGSCDRDHMAGVEDVAVGGGKLIATDSDQNRVFIWNTIPLASGTQPDIVLGQADFTHCEENDDDQDGTAGAPSARTLNYPGGLWTDGTKLIVSDSDNNRVLIWNTFPTVSFQPADVVIGQATMTTNASTLFSFPYGLDSNGNQLAIADDGNHRVLIWDGIPTANDSAPYRVLGQSDLSHKKANDDDQNNASDSRPSARTLRNPKSVAFIGEQLIVTDHGNFRYAVYGQHLCDNDTFEFPASSGMCMDNPCLPEACGDHGSCANTTGAAVCTCSTGYTGASCSACANGYVSTPSNTCVIDPCTANACSQHGSCSNTTGAAVCTCATGYAGAACDTCASGYESDQSDPSLCFPDACSGNPCGLHYRCSLLGTGFTCACDVGYTGPGCLTCDTGYYPSGPGVCTDDPCLPDPCNGNGACSNNTGSAVCTCTGNHTGAVCDACPSGTYEDGTGACIDDPCLPDPCNGHGSCSNDTGAAVCTCTAGWEATACDVCRYYVDGALSTNGDGAGWGTAFNDIGSAIAAASSASSSGVTCQVWVKTGTFHHLTITLADNVHLYGGFSGAETTVGDRDYEAHPTILDGRDAFDSAVRSNWIIRSAATNARLDGFTVQYGNAVVGGGDDKGGGLAVQFGSLAVANCRFEYNHANGSGGGIFAEAFGGSTALAITNTYFGHNDSSIGGAVSANGGVTLSIDGSTFERNVTTSTGGAVRSGGSLTLTNSRFFANTATIDGGAIFAGSESITLENIEAVGNDAGTRGGGIAISAPSGSHPILRNITLYGNNASLAAGLFFDSPSAANAQNLIIWANNGSSQLISPFDVFPTYSLFPNATGTGNIDSPPAMVNVPSTYRFTTNAGTTSTIEVSDAALFPVSSVIGIDDDGVARTVVGATGTTVTFAPALSQATAAKTVISLWADGTTNVVEDFSLHASSPGVDAGNGDVAPSTDRLGNARIDQILTANTGAGTPDYVDMGALESHERHLAFATQPTTMEALAPLSITVRVENADGTLYTTPESVILAAAHPAGSVLSGTTAVLSSGGLATFFVTAPQAGMDVRLIAIAAGIQGAESDTFDLTTSAKLGTGFIYALSGTNALDLYTSLDVSNAIAIGTISGMQPSETMLAVDFRPSTGDLYGLGSTGRLYVIDTATAIATEVTAAALPTITGRAGLDFNPLSDRARVVTQGGESYRINPTDGSFITDGTLNGDTSSLDAAAYTNNWSGATGTTLYGLDGVANGLYLVNPPNFGKTTFLGSLSADGSPIVGFDIAGSNTAYAVLMSGGVRSLSAIDLTNGSVSARGYFDAPTTYEIALDSPPAYAVTSTNALVTFSTQRPSKLTSSLRITGLQSGESIVGIDFRPTTGELFAIGSQSRVYRLDTISAVATFVATMATPLDGSVFAVDFEVGADMIFVTSDTGQSLKVSPVDGSTILYASLPLPITALASGNGVTYGIDPTGDTLLTVSPPTASATAIGSLNLDASSSCSLALSSLGVLYALLNSGLYVINVATGAASLVGALPNGVTINGLAVP